MWFKYIAVKAGGEVVTGTVEATTEQRAEELLWQSELTILSLKKTRSIPSVRELLPTFFGVKRDDVVNFSRDLSTLLGAGIAIIPSLVMLYERTTKPSMKKLIRDIWVSVETGSSYSDACAKHPTVFSPFYLRLTKVGEEIGNLEQMLEQIGIQMTKEAAVMAKVKSALTYPAFVLAVATVAVVALVTFVVPAMSGLFEQFGGELPLLTRIIVAVSDFFRGNILYLAFGFIVVIGVSVWFFGTPTGKRIRSTMALKIPIIKDVNIKGTMSRLARNLSILLGGGITLTESLELVIQTTDNVIFKEAFTKVRDDVHDGLLLSQAMRNQAIFPPMLTQVVGVGEHTGRLEPNLETVADFYEKETDKAVASATGMLTPIMTIVVGGIVALIAISMYTPIYGLAGQIGT
jgi:type IV pilus assembly protein PilC